MMSRNLTTFRFRLIPPEVSPLPCRAFGPRKCMKNHTRRSRLFNGLVWFFDPACAQTDIRSVGLLNVSLYPPCRDEAHRKRFTFAYALRTRLFRFNCQSDGIGITVARE